MRLDFGKRPRGKKDDDGDVDDDDDKNEIDKEEKDEIFGMQRKYALTMAPPPKYICVCAYTDNTLIEQIQFSEKWEWTEN